MSVTVQRKNPGWLKSLLGNAATVAGKEVACGYPRGKCQAYPDGEQVAQVAANNCFGNGVPQRDFMAYAQDGIISKTRPLLRRIAQLANLNGNHDSQIDKLREQAGNVAAGAIKSAIRDGSYTPNSPDTIKRKGSSKPLIDTGHMIQSTTYVVRDTTK